MSNQANQLYVGLHSSRCGMWTLHGHPQGFWSHDKEYVLKQAESIAGTLLPLLSYTSTSGPRAFWTSQINWIRIKLGSIGSLDRSCGWKRNLMTFSATARWFLLTLWVSMGVMSEAWSSALLLKKTKYQFYVLPLRSRRGGRPTRLDTTLSDKIASS